MEIESTMKEHENNLSDIRLWVEEKYQYEFEELFRVPLSLIDKVDKGTITDEELQSILIDLPLDLFQVSERSNNYKLFKEVIKLGMKERKLDMSYSKKDSEAYMKDSYKVIEDEAAMLGVDSLITRVDKQVSMCKELIMGAKKIWDARRATENVCPVNPPEDELPEYN